MKDVIVSLIISAGIFLATLVILDCVMFFLGVDLLHEVTAYEDTSVAAGILAFIYYTLIFCWVYLEIGF